MRRRSAAALLGLFYFAAAVSGGRDTSIVFTTLGRSRYAFDIYAVDLPVPKAEVCLTDCRSVNYNGHFAAPSSLVYVSERNASSNIFHCPVPAPAAGGGGYDDDAASRRSMLDGKHKPLLLTDGISMKDRPSIAGDHLVYVSTHEDPGEARKSWAAVYSTNLRTGKTVRLTPPRVADFSPAVSPSGEWTAVASAGERGWEGEIDDLRTAIYVFRTCDGSERRKVVEHGGWPAWADDSSLYFHRPSADDGWWSVYKVSLRSAAAAVERITPPGLHAFTPAAAPGGAIIAVATRRPESNVRHIELFDVENKVFLEITKGISPNAHHYNPFVSPDGRRLGYHRCRGKSDEQNNGLLLLENRRSPLPGVSLFRIDGSLPSFSPDGRQIAFVGLPGLFVANSDGSARREIFSGDAFGTAWDPKRKGVFYTSIGPRFASEASRVDIVAVHIDQPDAGGVSMRKLTTGGANNAFPWPSPDGKWIVFRSGRSGHKNLYIMDAAAGEAGGIRRLTAGNWTDTMCSWSPAGDWIAFSSDREQPGSGNFAIFFIRPDGSGLKKVFESGPAAAGRANHPVFHPDGRRIAFTSDHAAVSAEPIANPNQYQPYGDIFVADVDGSHVTRVTHNSYEDGSPAWGPKYVKPHDVQGPSGAVPCMFDDCHFLAQAQDVEMKPTLMSGC